MEQTTVHCIRIASVQLAKRFFLYFKVYSQMETFFSSFGFVVFEVSVKEDDEKN